MNGAAWRELMQTWSDDWLGVADRRWPASVRRSLWLGYKPATDRQIAQAEKRLGIELPPSYKAFLRVSDGWRNTTPFVDKLLPIREVAWFAADHPSWIDAYGGDNLSPELPTREYFSYGQEASLWFEPRHLRHTLQISAVGDAEVVLLNPDAVTADGEWEAWFFANWQPSVTRYPSFAALMRRDYAVFRQLLLNDKAVVLPSGPYAGPAAPDAPRHAAERDWDKFRRACETFDGLVARLDSQDDAERGRAAARLQGHVRGRAQAERRPDLQDTLERHARHGRESVVRQVAVLLLNGIGDEEPTRLLDLELLDDPDASVAYWALYGLHWLADARAVGPLCRVLERSDRPDMATTAASILATLGDARAIGPLAGALDAIPDEEQNPRRVAFATALAEFGESGLARLLDAFDDPRPEVRLAVVCVIDSFDDARAKQALRRAVADVDERVRARAAQTSVGRGR